MVILDTDVLLLAFAFQRDECQPINTIFLLYVQSRNAAVTIYSLMEILGKLSFKLAHLRLSAWQSWLVNPYGLYVIWPVNPQETIAQFSFRAEIFERLFERMMLQRSGFVDSLILGLADRSPDAEAFITWNARHFKGKSTLKVLTPKEYLV